MIHEIRTFFQAPQAAGRRHAGARAVFQYP
jgi:hypothetical protein